MRQTKIIATLGPASSDAGTVRELVAAGVDVFRLNFSHGDRETHGAAIARVRTAAREAGRIVAVLQDLGGPKIRTGPLRGGAPIELKPGDELHIGIGSFEGYPGRISTEYADLPGLVHRGDVLLLDDGRIQLRVEESRDGDIRTTVVEGGLLQAHAGINVPGAALPHGGLTEKDAADLRFGVQAGIDMVAVSFVRCAADVHEARDALRREGAPDLPIVAKLERAEAIARLDEILRASDAVMVARGDLGLEVPLERVPRLQKEITRRARALGLPVIVATQVLESMRQAPRPTRAEVSDAANAVDDRVDAIMLAGETAVGAHPVRAVQTLDAIIRDAEGIPPVGVVPVADDRVLAGPGRAICEAAITLAHRAAAAAIVAVTRGGRTARLLSALRPATPIVAATGSPEIARRLALWWGVVPVIAEPGDDVAETAARIGRMLVERGAIRSGAGIVVVSVTSDLAQGPSNFVKLQQAG